MIRKQYRNRDVCIFFEAKETHIMVYYSSDIASPMLGQATIRWWKKRDIDRIMRLVDKIINNGPLA